MLILVRHGQSISNAEGRLVGRRMDPALSELGVRQAGDVGSALAGRQISELVSSPLSRARQTAELISGRCGLPARVDQRWIELDYGDLDGTMIAEMDPALWKSWMEDPHFRPPGGETLVELGVRVRSICEELFAVENAGARGEGDVVVVSHVSPIKAAVAWALGGDDDLCWRLHLSTGSVTRISWRSGRPVLEQFNGAS